MSLTHEAYAQSLQSVAGIAASLRSGAVSCVELTERRLESAQSLNDSLNCILTFTPEAAMAQAKAADERIAKGEAGPLTGVPLVHKDLFCTEGIRTTCGSRMLENFCAPYNATVVEMAAQAGAVMLGKANMDEFAMGSSTENSVLRPHPKPLGHGQSARWFLWRIRSGSGGGLGPGGDRHGHRRLNSPTRSNVRGYRHQTHLWPGIALRPSRLRLKP